MSRNLGTLISWNPLGHSRPVTGLIFTVRRGLYPFMFDMIYRGADKSLARPWKETSYSEQDLQHYTKTYGVQTGIHCCCLYALSLGIVL